MKSWLLALVAGIVGLAIGVGSTVAEFWSAREIFDTAGLISNSGNHVTEHVHAPPSLGVGGKVEVVGSNRFDFGAMPTNRKASHEFVLKNVGTTPLQIEVEGTTCKCTLADLVDKQLAPGRETKVLLEWETKTANDVFEQAAELKTSDPNNPVVRLTIAGRIVAPVQAKPNELALPSLAIDRDATGQIKLFGFVADVPLEIKRHSFLNPDQLEHYEVEITPMPAEMLAAEPDAKSGQLLTLRLKSGLRLGAIRQTIRLETNAPGLPEMEIPIHGTVASDISLLHQSGARRFDEARHVLLLGTLKANEGAVVRLYFLIKGEHRDSTQIEVGSVDPGDALQVKLEEPKKLNDGRAIRIPLVITIPPDAPVMDRTGGGEGKPGSIVFRTTHPLAKELRLEVQFAKEK